MADGKRDVNALMDRDFEAFPPRNFVERFAWLFRSAVADPMVALRNYIHSKHEPYYWYHRKYQRVPTIDQCYDYDVICQFEADQQLKRDRLIDENIIHILKSRLTDCMVYERYEREKCRHFLPIIKEAETNFFIKYGEGGSSIHSRIAFMKQKHRMAWERRHGEVGTGMRDKHFKSDGTAYWK